MPPLVSWPHKECGCGNRVANQALVDKLADCLVRTAKEGVRRTAHAKESFFRCFEQFRGLFDIEAERLLRVDMLSCFDHLLADCRMGSGHSQIYDDLDLRIGEKVGNALCLKTEFPRPRLGNRHIDVSYPANLQDWERFCGSEICRTDIAATNEANSDSFYCTCFPARWGAIS